MWAIACRAALALSLVCCLVQVVVASTTARQVLVVAGNFSLDGELLNVAQYEVSSGRWSAKYHAELFVYGASNGVIWDVAVNRTSKPYSQMFVVGAFDTESKTSQLQFCSVGEFNGLSFNKVGEGLCPRGEDSSTAVQIYTTTLGNDGDLFVGGSFESRVWDGHHFVGVYHIAQYRALSSSWLPMVAGMLGSVDNDPARVSSLAWDGDRVLYIGGTFDRVDDTPLTSGLAVWSQGTGLKNFPGGGVYNSMGGSANSRVKCIAFDPTSRSLFIAGTFQQVGDKKLPCNGVAVWHHSGWRCLHDEMYGISSVTAMLLTDNALYLSGWAASLSTWTGGAVSPYVVARMDVVGFIEEHTPQDDDSHKKTHDDDDGDDKGDKGGKGGAKGGNNKNSTSTSKDDHSSKGRRLRRAGVHVEVGEGTGGMGASIGSIDIGSGSSSSVSSGRSEYHPRTVEGGGARYPEDAPCEGAQGRVCRARPARHLLLNPPHTHDSHYDHTHNHTARRANTKHAIHFSHPDPAPPTQSPTPTPWVAQWEWLVGFKGGNGPIFRLAEGREEMQGYIFIAGSFDNYPALVVWRSDPEHRKGASTNKGNISFIPGSHQMSGLITSVVQAYLPFEPVPSPVVMELPKDYTFLILVGCVGMGIMLGLGFAVGCFGRRGYTLLPNSLDPDFKGNGNMAGGLSLTTLSGSGVYGATVDFKECFKRAMAARHLPTHEALLIINPKEIVLSRIIGEGSFGRVWSGQWRNNAVAVKEFVFAQAAIVGGSLQRSNIIEEIVGEAGIMACLRHPKILQLYGCSLTMQAIWIVSELCVKGSLKMVLAQKDIDLPFIQKLSICMDIADGMYYLHTRSPPVIHRDLKSHNIFITELSPGNLVAKIGDWGSARAVALSGQKNMTQGVGTACWLSPEVINNAHFSKYSDVYAFGIILWEVFTRQEVYEGLSAAQIIAKVAHEGLRPHVPRDCAWEAVMTACWRESPSERPSFHAVLGELSKMYQDMRGINAANVESAHSSDHSFNCDSHEQKGKSSSLSASPASPQYPLQMALSPESKRAKSLDSKRAGVGAGMGMGIAGAGAGGIGGAGMGGGIAMDRRPSQMNFDVSDLTGPSYYIVKETDDFIFEDHKGAGQQEERERYIGDKALKPTPKRYPRAHGPRSPGKS